MAVRRISIPWGRQPQEDCRLDWDNPINRGLIGFVWAGPGGPRDLIDPELSLSRSGVTEEPATGGIASIVGTAANSGVYTPRVTYGAWRPTTVPITLAAFMGHTTPAGSRPIAGTINGSTGYGLWDLFGSRDRRAAAKVGGTNRTRDSGQWSTGAKVRGMTVTDTALTGYDDGLSFGTTSYSSATSLDYEGTFDRLYLLGSPDNSSSAGEGYWMALWNRALSADEMLHLADDPWCQFAPQQIWVPRATVAAGVPTLSAPSAFNITATTATPRVTVTF